MTTDPDVDDELEPDELVLPPVEVWACEPEPELLRTITPRMGKRGPLKAKVVNTPAALFGARAEAAGWAVEYRYARGPLAKRTRPDEPNEHGKYALVTTITVVDTIGVRARHPDGRAVVAWWIGSEDSWGFGEGWAASPRRNARALGKNDLTAYLTDEEVLPMAEQEQKDATPIGVLFAQAKAAFDEGAENRQESPAARMPHNLFTDGYLAGHAAASEKAGDAYGEGFAAGVAEVAGRGRAWVASRKRLDALRPGDVILGKKARWWIVGGFEDLGAKQWLVRASSGDDSTEVRGPANRLVDVVVEIDVAAALDVLKEGLDAKPARADGVAA